MQANDIIAAIHGSYAGSSKNGLQNMQALMTALGSPALPPVIHIAGTNGKGSTCAMLERCLREAGYHTGLYTSPFLQRYQERIRLNGVPIGDAALVRWGEPLLQAAEALRSRGISPTPFELGTALAFSAFAGEGVDVAIVEVGLGGRLDPTNIVQPILCAITAIGLDHMAYLGDTLPEIAGEKAGIIKPGIPVVCAPAEAAVAEVFRHRAADLKAPLLQLSTEQIKSPRCSAHGNVADFLLGQAWRDVSLSLPGAHQLENALTVLALVEELRAQGYLLPTEAVLRGLAHTVWPARLEWAGQVLIDGAHNPQGMTALAQFVHAHLMDRPRVLLTGVMEDKLQPELLSAMASLAPQAVTVTPRNPRSMSADRLAGLLRPQGIQAQAAPSLTEGLETARRLAGSNGIVLVAGSLYLAGEVRTALGLAESASGAI